MLAQQKATGSCLRTPSRLSSKVHLRPCTARRQVATRAGMDTNFFVNLVASTACGGMAAAVTLITAENTEKEVSCMPTTIVKLSCSDMCYSARHVMLVLGLVK